MTRTALVINEKQDCQALESNLIKQQDFHKMSLKSIGQYWNHLRRCKYDKLWFSWRRQRAHCLPSIIHSTVCIVLSFSSHCCQEFFLSLLEFRGFRQYLGHSCPSRGHFGTCGAEGRGLVVPTGSRVLLGQQGAPVCHPSAEALALNSGIVCWAAQLSHLNFPSYFPSLPSLRTGTHIFFKLFCPRGKANVSDIFITFIFAS